MCQVTVAAAIGFDRDPSGRPRNILVRGTATDCALAFSDSQGSYSRILVEAPEPGTSGVRGTAKLRAGQFDWTVVLKTGAYACGAQIHVVAVCNELSSTCRFDGELTVVCATCRDVDIDIRDDGCDDEGRRLVHASARVNGGPYPSDEVTEAIVTWVLNDGTQNNSNLIDNRTEIDLVLSNAEIAADNVTLQLSPNCAYPARLGSLGACPVPPEEPCPADFSLAVTRNGQPVDTSASVSPGNYRIAIVSAPSAATAITWWDDRIRVDGGQEIVEATAEIASAAGSTSIDYTLPSDDRRHRITAKTFISPTCIPIGSVTLRPTRATRTDPGPVTEVKPCPELGGIDVKGCAAGEVTLSASGSDLERALQWEWDFGDGQTLVAGSVVTHPYAQRRSFTAKVTMTRPAECRPAIETATVTVPACSDGGNGNGPPSVAFGLCAIWLLFVLFCMVVGAILFPVGFCVMVDASFTGYGFWIGLVIFLIGAAFLVAGAFMLMEWLRICGVIPEACELVQLLWEVLAVLTLIAGAAAVVVTALLQWCGLPVAFDAAYFGFFTFVVLWFSRAIGCDLVPRWFRRILRWLGFA